MQLKNLTYQIKNIPFARLRCIKWKNISEMHEPRQKIVKPKIDLHLAPATQIYMIEVSWYCV